MVAACERAWDAGMEELVATCLTDERLETSAKTGGEWSALAQDAQRRLVAPNEPALLKHLRSMRDGEMERRCRDRRSVVNVYSVRAVLVAALEDAAGQFKAKALPLVARRWEGKVPADAQAPLWYASMVKWPSW